MPLDYHLEERTLPNGLRVVIQPDHRTPMVTVNIWVGVGSRHETVGRTGFAHLFEHLMFQGSESLPKLEHFRVVQGSGGVFNGSTHPDYTDYFEVLPSAALERALARLDDYPTMAEAAAEAADRQYRASAYGDAIAGVLFR